jgi:hypothetical protein
MKGYVDVLTRAPPIESGGRERVRICDYKTGRVPTPVKRERKMYPNIYYSKELPNKYTFEGNFYCLMYLLSQGYEIKKQDGDYWIFYKGEKVVCNWLEYEFIFTNTGETAYRCRKKCSLKSIRASFRKMKEIDDFHRDFKLGRVEYEREPNEWICKSCSHFLEDCVHEMDPVEARMISSLIIPEDIHEKKIE